MELIGRNCITCQRYFSLGSAKHNECKECRAKPTIIVRGATGYVRVSPKGEVYRHEATVVMQQDTVIQQYQPGTSPMPIIAGAPPVITSVPPPGMPTVQTVQTVHPSTPMGAPLMTGPHPGAPSGFVSTVAPPTVPPLHQQMPAPIQTQQQAPPQYQPPPQQYLPPPPSQGFPPQQQFPSGYPPGQGLPPSMQPPLPPLPTGQTMKQGVPPQPAPPGVVAAKMSATSGAKQPMVNVVNQLQAKQTGTAQNGQAPTQAYPLVTQPHSPQGIPPGGEVRPQGNQSSTQQNLQSMPPQQPNGTIANGQPPTQSYPQAYQPQSPQGMPNGALLQQQGSQTLQKSSAPQGYPPPQQGPLMPPQQQQQPQQGYQQGNTGYQPQQGYGAPQQPYQTVQPPQQPQYSGPAVKQQQPQQQQQQFYQGQGVSQPQQAPQQQYPQVNSSQSYGPPPQAYQSTGQPQYQQAGY